MLPPEMLCWLGKAERWRARSPEPLRLRLWLRSPVAFDGWHGLTIEGLLQFYVVCRETNRLPDDVFAGYDGPAVDIPIPFSDVEIAGRPIACASVAQAPSIAVESLRFRRKRARAENYGVDKLMINGGLGKGLNIPVATMVTPFLDFYVVGDRFLIEALACDVGGLGRDSTRGLGTILGLEVEPISEDRSLVYNGRPMRSIPIVLDGGDYDPRNYVPNSWIERETTTRAPYWHQRSATLCVVPVRHA